ncbi:MAG: transposase [Acidobacteria bacterium]|nr:transposase [Acidobacteriota bacterium]
MNGDRHFPKERAHTWRRRSVRAFPAEGSQAGSFHCISRVVNRRFSLSDPEKETFRKILRACEAFYGLKTLTYCAVRNHIHVIVELDRSSEMTRVCLRMNGDRHLSRQQHGSRGGHRHRLAQRDLRPEVGLRSAHGAGRDEGDAGSDPRVVRRRDEGSDARRPSGLDESPDRGEAESFGADLGPDGDGDRDDRPSGGHGGEPGSDGHGTSHGSLVRAVRLGRGLRAVLGDGADGEFRADGESDGEALGRDPDTRGPGEPVFPGPAERDRPGGSGGRVDGHGVGDGIQPVGDGGGPGTGLPDNGRNGALRDSRLSRECATGFSRGLGRLSADPRSEHAGCRNLLGADEERRNGLAERALAPGGRSGGDVRATLAGGALAGQEDPAGQDGDRGVRRERRSVRADGGLRLLLLHGDGRKPGVSLTRTGRHGEDLGASGVDRPEADGDDSIRLRDRGSVLGRHPAFGRPERQDCRRDASGDGDLRGDGGDEPWEGPVPADVRRSERGPVSGEVDPGERTRSDAVFEERLERECEGALGDAGPEGESRWRSVGGIPGYRRRDIRDVLTHGEPDEPGRVRGGDGDAEGFGSRSLPGNAVGQRDEREERGDRSHDSAGSEQGDGDASGGATAVRDHVGAAGRDGGAEAKAHQGLGSRPEGDGKTSLEPDDTEFAGGLQTRPRRDAPAGDTGHSSSRTLEGPADGSHEEERDHGAAGDRGTPRGEGDPAEADDPGCERQRGEAPGLGGAGTGRHAAGQADPRSGRNTNRVRRDRVRVARA